MSLVELCLSSLGPELPNCYLPLNLVLCLPCWRFLCLSYLFWFPLWQHGCTTPLLTHAQVVISTFTMFSLYNNFRELDSSVCGFELYKFCCTYNWKYMLCDTFWFKLKLFLHVSLFSWHLIVFFFLFFQRRNSIWSL